MYTTTSSLDKIQKSLLAHSRDVIRLTSPSESDDDLPILTMTCRGFRRNAIDGARTEKSAQYLFIVSSSRNHLGTLISKKFTT